LDRRFDGVKIWYAASYRQAGHGGMFKNALTDKIQDGGGRHLGFGQIAITFEPVVRLS
jgi:hypothetical protein